MFENARHVATAAAVGLLMTVTAACASDQASKHAASSTGRDAVLSSALLATEDVGPAFSTSHGEEADLPDGIGIDCFRGPGEIIPIDSAEVVFSHVDGGFPLVFNSVETYRDVGDVQEVMDDLRAGVVECDNGTASHSNITFTLDSEVRQVANPAGVDDQVVWDATGSVKTAGVSLNVSLSLSVAGVGRRISVVGVVDLGDQPSAELGTYAAAARGRLVTATTQVP